MRWSDLDPIWQAAVDQAWQARLCGSYPIGAVVTNANGDIIVRGRNHIHDEIIEGRNQISRSKIAHAEINALTQITSSDEKSSPILRLYTTLEPCPLCFGAFYVSKVRELYYAARDAFGGSTNLIHKTTYLSNKPKQIFAPLIPALEIIIVALLTEFYIDSNIPEQAMITSTLNDQVPQGVALGNSLCQSQIIQLWIREKVGTAVRIDQLFILAEDYA